MMIEGPPYLIVTGELDIWCNDGKPHIYEVCWENNQGFLRCRKCGLKIKDGVKPPSWWERCRGKEEPKDLAARAKT